MASERLPERDDDAALLAWLREEAARPVEGWDFSYLAGRMCEDAPPWEYRQVVTAALYGSGSLLDLGTGGGEFLSSLGPLPGLTCATEGYAPNLPVARRRLEPLGIAVSEVGDDCRLPYPDGTFDLVISRHEAYDPREVRRVLRPGGHFITQQVGGTYLLGLNRLLGAPDPPDEFAINVGLGLPGDSGEKGGGAAGPYARWNLDFARRQVEAAGLAISRAEEAFPAVAFADVGVIVSYLSMVPWQVPAFSVERYFEPLRDLHRRCQDGGGITLSGHLFIIAAARLEE